MRMFGGRSRPRLMRFDDALAALGADGVMERRVADVPLAQVVGTVDRPDDFDQEFRLVNAHLQGRWRSLARAMAAGVEPPPVDLVQLGELYFVADGHHRVSVARELGRLVITARVRRICTIAYGMACLRAVHLASKRAELEFLRRVPLPEPVRTDLWLDTPAEWLRLADAAQAWALDRTLAGQAPTDREELAADWWADEVAPVLARLRTAGHGLDLRDVQLYATALAIRDRRGSTEWPADLTELWPRTAARRRTALLR
ncbi:hypothetical protein Athai_49820 [Actinocatenispora thailandica]|uniref:Chromosome partitioning protein ParB n=1 Tax=Actinocatenispora thailandica TaxID=227318 RepID=A0A7R7DTD6_9ACTN|nr:ParB N-terminal domain-containing protein [Actinocatenispora thailandica]BCJ37479.1 hypothetical protein Athai_49820 [Actinocatenispora thailandica]